MPREEDQEVEIRRLAKDTRSIEHRASLFNGRSSQNTLPAAILQDVPSAARRQSRHAASFDATARAVHALATTTGGPGVIAPAHQGVVPREGADDVSSRGTAAGHRIANIAHVARSTTRAAVNCLLLDRPQPPLKPFGLDPRHRTDSLGHQTPLIGLQAYADPVRRLD